MRISTVPYFLTLLYISTEDINEAYKDLEVTEEESYLIISVSLGALPGGYRCSRFEKSAAMENTSECIGSLSGSHTKISLALPTTKRTVVQVMITAENRNVRPTPLKGKNNT